MSEADWIGFPGCRALGDEERAAVDAVLTRRTLYRGKGLVTPQEVQTCEAQLAALLGRRYAILMNSGTSALMAGLQAFGVKAGDEVVLPGYGWLTDLSSVLQIGAVPVFAPVDASLNLDPARLAECLSDRTKLLAPVHAAGRPFDAPAIAAIARQHGIPLMEDVCQCLGGRIDGLPAGSHGEASVYSFQAFKIVTGGEGGAFVTDDEDVYLKAFRFHDAGLSRFSVFGNRPDANTAVGIGLNLRMNELTAALIRVQLHRLPQILTSLQQARQILASACAEAIQSGAVSLPQPRMGIEDNASYLLLQARDAKTAVSLKESLHELGYPVRLASAARLHTLPGWLDYLETHGFPYRVVDAEASFEVLDRALLLEVNWAMSENLVERFQADLRSALQRF